MNDIKKIERRKQTVAYLLNSDNYFIENLLIYLSDTNIHIKKVIINFLRVLTQLYGDLLDQYFAKNKSKKNKRIIKEEFYIFIKENIAPNYYNKIYQIFSQKNQLYRLKKEKIVLIKTINYYWVKEII